MKKYSDYKDSGIEWIGEIPEHWMFLSVRRITEDHKQGYYSSDGYSDDGHRLVRITDLDANGNIDIDSSPYVNPNDSELVVFKIKKGDVLFPRTGSIGLVGVAKEDMKAVFASYLIRFRFNDKVNVDFLKLFFISTPFLNGVFSDLHGGVNQNIHAENIKDQYLALPPSEEQTTIANYLDRKTTEIDTLIEKKKQLIALYKEERTATINAAVTGKLQFSETGFEGLKDGQDLKEGNNPDNQKILSSCSDRKMKDSGIDWIGEIPEHWEVKRLKYCINDIFLGLTGKVDYVENENQGVPLIRAGNLAGGKVTLDDVRYISFTQHEELTKYRKVQKGDVLVTKSGSIGVCAILPFDGEFSLYESVFAIRTKDEILNNELLLFILNSHMLKHQYTAELAGMGVHHLNMGDMKNTIVIIPPQEDQPELIAKTKHRLGIWNKCISKTEKEIELLQEYKTALISEVVLGKVDVREETV